MTNNVKLISVDSTAVVAPYVILCKETDAAVL